MNLFKSFVKNIIISNLWSVILVLVAASFCADFIDNDVTFIIFICWFINAIISFIIHAFLFVPGVIIYNKNNEDGNTSEAFSSIYPLLLIPLALYLFIMSLILGETSSSEPLAFGIITFIGIVLMAMHSISLYTFINHHFKNTNHEAIIE